MRPLMLVSALLLLACSTSADPLSEDVGSEDVTEVQGTDAPSPDAAPEDLVALPPPEPVVFSVGSDTHIVGDESHGISQRLAQCLSTVAGLSPAPEAHFITGDLIDSLKTTDSAPHGFLPTFKALIEASAVPVYPVAGNHDYYAQNHPQFLLTDDPTAPDEMRRDVLGIEPYYAVVLNGVKFILLNSMQGELWNISLGLSGSLGAEQLAWLDQELSDGAPAVLFLHHPPELTEEPEGEATLTDVVAAHNDIVLGIFAGHLHLWSKTELVGVPVYLTAANQDGVNFHHARVDPDAMELQILNEGDIDYGEFEVSSCDPEGKVAVTDWTPFEGALHHLLIESAVAEPSGFGEYLQEGIQMLPLVLRFEGPDASGKVLSGQLTIGSYVGNGVGSIPPYIDAVDGSPCLVIDLLLDNPCFLSQPVNLTMDIAKGLGLAFPPGWNARVGLENVQLQGYASVDDTPKLKAGTLSMGVDFNLTIADLQSIVLQQYCGGKIAGCQPGSDGMPECPGGSLDLASFDQVPPTCDVVVAGFGLRMFLALLASVPDGKGSIQAIYESWEPEISDSAKVGGVNPELFSTEPGGNCAP